MVKNPAANAGDVGLIPGSGRSPEEGNGNPLQYSCLGNPWTEEPCGLQSMGLRKNWTGLSDETATTTILVLYGNKPPLSTVGQCPLLAIFPT